MSIEKVSVGEFTIETSINQGKFPEDPRTFGSLGIVDVFESKQPFWEKAESLFGKDAEEMIPCLANGELFWTRDGDPVLGIERYRHGSEILAVSKTGNFPDRRWDVSPIVGWWSPGEANSDLKEKIKDLKKNGDEGEIKKILTERANSDLSVINQWSSGDIWDVRVEVRDKSGSVIAENELHGCYGHDHAQTEAVSMVETLKIIHDPKKIVEINSKDTVKPLRRPKI